MGMMMMMSEDTKKCASCDSKVMGVMGGLVVAVCSAW